MNDVLHGASCIGCLVLGAWCLVRGEDRGVDTTEEEEEGVVVEWTRML